MFCNKLSRYVLTDSYTDKTTPFVSVINKGVHFADEVRNVYNDVFLV